MPGIETFLLYKHSYVFQVSLGCIKPFLRGKKWERELGVGYFNLSTCESEAGGSL